VLLRWNSYEFDNIHQVVLHSDQIWTPDIVLFNAYVSFLSSLAALFVKNLATGAPHPWLAVRGVDRLCIQLNGLVIGLMGQPVRYDR